MSCIHFGGNEEAWCNANAAPDLPKSHIPKRESKIQRLKRLAEDPRPMIRAAVAGNVDCPGWLLHRLATDESKVVRSWVARNPNTRQRTLRFLRRSHDPDIAAYARMRLRDHWVFSLLRALLGKG